MVLEVWLWGELNVAVYAAQEAVFRQRDFAIVDEKSLGNQFRTCKA